LLAANELWFVLVANPDGYQYTFDHERFWRKNLRERSPRSTAHVDGHRFFMPLRLA
jgi:hypothetical protein